MLKRASQLASVMAIMVLCMSGVSAQTSLAGMKKRLAQAEASKQQQDIRYWTNVISLHQSLKQRELEGVRCGKVPPSADADAATREKAMSELSDAALEKLVPALAAFLKTPVGTGVVVFLQPTAIAKDAFQIIDNANTGEPTEVIAASRRMLLDTIPASMAQLSPKRKAVIYKCGHQVAN